MPDMIWRDILGRERIATDELGGGMRVLSRKEQKEYEDDKARAETERRAEYERSRASAESVLDGDYSFEEGLRACTESGRDFRVYDGSNRLILDKFTLRISGAHIRYAVVSSDGTVLTSEMPADSMRCEERTLAWTHPNLINLRYTMRFPKGCTIVPAERRERP